MSIFATLGIMLAVIAGIINLAFGLIRRKQIPMAMMRFALSIVSFVGAAWVIVARLGNEPVLPTDLNGNDSFIYPLVGLALFVGLTLMLPATVERNNPAVQEEEAAEAPKRETGTLSSGQAGVRIANQSDEWVN